MFTLYELAGVVTNLAAGIMGAKWGIKITLICGLGLQIFSYGLLFGWDPNWDKNTSILYVTITQMFAGIAKDLTKLGGKTVTKLVTPEDQSTKLFQLVSFITGMKNSAKGIGYFLGAALLNVSYELALGTMMGLVLLAMPWAIFGLENDLGTAKKNNSSLSQIFKLENHNLNVLCWARLLLFASRDFWFEVPLPFYLRSPPCLGLGDVCASKDDCDSGAICDAVCINPNIGGGCGGPGLDRLLVGAFLGAYIILYGQVQSWTPQLVTGPLRQSPPNKLTLVLWNGLNCLPTLLMVGVLSTPSFDTLDGYDTTTMIVWLIIILVFFAILFAINSSIHSFLVVQYAKTEKVAVSVGFYYMSNAAGRLLGTLGSGILYTYVGESAGEYAGIESTMGFLACFVAGTISSFLATVVTTRIEDQQKGLKCGGCWTLVKEEDKEEIEAI